MKRIAIVAFLALLVAGGTAQAAEYLYSGFQNAGYSTTIAGAVFTNINPRTTGTGFVDPFLKFTDNATVEMAFNYDTSTLSGVSWNDAYGSNNWTHLLWSGDLLQIDGSSFTGGVAGTKYWEFILDIDQAPGGNAYFSLDALALYWSNNTTFNPATAPTVTLGSPGLPTVPGSAHLFYDLDTGLHGDAALGLNYSLNTGSGSGDLKVMVPVPAGAPATGAWIYLYNALGYYGADYGNNNGPDEWWATTGVNVPEPTSMLLLGTGLVGLARFARRKR